MHLMVIKESDDDQAMVMMFEVIMVEMMMVEVVMVEMVMVDGRGRWRVKTHGEKER
jgi:hypothetical protein